jgi:uroporphyrinogen decarboxylase
MRQAGRYLPGYQAVRAKVGFLELCRRPDLSAEVSLEPIERFGMDGAIVFSDILIPLEAMGLTVEFDDRGPLLPEPLRDGAAVAGLGGFDAETGTPWILETIARLREAVPPETAVLGFAGAPFTLAVYAVEGRVTKSLVHAKSLRYREPDAFAALLMHLAEQTVGYLAAQARAGAQALQLFDTWAGELSRADWLRFALPSVRRVFDGVREELGEGCPPLVLFSRGTAPWAGELARTGADAYSVDWRLPLGVWKDALGGAPVQGNLEPTALFASEETVRGATRAMLNEVSGRDGIVVNLGHGILPGTPPDNVAAFVDEVQKG